MFEYTDSYDDTYYFKLDGSMNMNELYDLSGTNSYQSQKVKDQLILKLLLIHVMEYMNVNVNQIVLMYLVL